MLWGIIILFVVVWGVLFYTYRDVFSPWSVTLLIWALIMSMYELFDHGLYNVTMQFVNAVMIWALTFSIASYCAFRLTPNYNGKTWAINENVVNVYRIIAYIAAPLVFIKSVSFALSHGGATDLVYTLREQTIDEDSGFSLGPLAYVLHIVYVLLFVTVDRDKINKRDFMLTFIVSMAFFFGSMSKTTLFVIFVSILYLLYSRKKITLKPIIIFAVAFTVLGLLFTWVRGSTEENEMVFTFGDLLAMYTVSPIVAFSYETAECSSFFGEYTLRFYNSLMYSLGFSDVQALGPIQEFTKVPIPTNVYTVMAPYFRDFGYKGIFYFALFEGLVIGWLYKMSESGHNVLRLIYTYIVVLLVLQFFDENIFVGLSNLIQIIILIWLCHIKFEFSSEVSKDSTSPLKDDNIP